MQRTDDVGSGDDESTNPSQDIEEETHITVLSFSGFSLVRSAAQMSCSGISFWYQRLYARRYCGLGREDPSISVASLTYDTDRWAPLPTLLMAMGAGAWLIVLPYGKGPRDRPCSSAMTRRRLYTISAQCASFAASAVNQLPVLRQEDKTHM